jgi:NADH-quinone oxidoreductase subunit G
MNRVILTIDGCQVEAFEETTILEAARKAGIKIPTLCYHPDQSIKANCRMCIVEVEGMRLLQAACSTPVKAGMVIKTNTRLVREARRTILELILAHHPQDCLQCIRNQKCELQTLTQQYNIRDNRFENTVEKKPLDLTSPGVHRDPNKCIKCGRCIEVCDQVQTVAVYAKEKRGFMVGVSPVFGLGLGEVACINCGQCILACPVGAIYENDQHNEVWDAINSSDKHVVCQIAPAIRVSLAEEFGLEPGELEMGKIVAALRQIGFDEVMHTNFTADLTIMEEGNELLDRMKNGGKLPLITSCSPGWIKFCEHFYPDFLENLSTCKSPQQMFGALAKTYYAEKAGIDPARIYSVSFMPCTAKKYECERPEMRSSGYKDVDVVLTTRELARMITEAGIDILRIAPEEFDPPMGMYTGAAVIFGATGGVTEAALRTVYEVATGETLQDIDFVEVRGMAGIKEATVDLSGTKVKVAIVHTTGNARKLLDAIRSGEKFYHFIEVMACPGGCIGGGGQPIGTTNARRARRLKALYNEDQDMPLRKSHENPAIRKIYDEFLNQPLSHKAHELLHTHYIKRSIYPLDGEKNPI